MSDTLGAAAPVEVTSTPDAVSTPNPISTEAEGHPAPDAKPEGKPDKAETKEAPKPLTARQALEKAAAKVEKDSKEAEAKPAAKEVKSEAKPDPKAEPKKDEKPRGEHGHFASKEPAKEVAPKPAEGLSSSGDEAPKWIKPHEKAAWSTMAPEQRAIAERRDREAAEGIEKYRPAAERDAALNEFHEMAKQHGKDLPAVVREYVNMENLLRAKPIDGIAEVMSRIGISPRQYAEHILGQTPDQVASQQDSVIRGLRGQVENLTKQVGTVSQTFQHQQATTVGNEVAKFAADPAHPRFEELHGDIAFFLKTKCPGDLKQAYELAERLNPAPANIDDALTVRLPVSSTKPQDLSLQTEKGQKSINGAPSPGSTPAARKPSNSIKESLKRAMAQAG